MLGEHRTFQLVIASALLFGAYAIWLFGRSLWCRRAPSVAGGIAVFGTLLYTLASVPAMADPPLAWGASSAYSKVYFFFNGPLLSLLNYLAYVPGEIYVDKPLLWPTPLWWAGTATMGWLLLALSTATLGAWSWLQARRAPAEP